MYFCDRVSLCNLSWLQIHRKPLASVFSVLESKGCSPDPAGLLYFLSRCLWLWLEFAKLVKLDVQWPFGSRESCLLFPNNRGYRRMSPHPTFSQMLVTCTQVLTLAQRALHPVSHLFTPSFLLVCSHFFSLHLYFTANSYDAHSQILSTYLSSTCDGDGELQTFPKHCPSFLKHYLWFLFENIV